MKKYIVLTFSIIFLFISGKINGQINYEELKSKYENYNKNDERALKYVKIYIQKAQQEKNYNELKQGYEDYAFYTANNIVKLKYADSAIAAAKKTRSNDILSSAHMYKGSLYYFYFKNYQSALDESLIAFEYSKKGNDEYLKYKIIYQIGLFKSYLGYYEEALQNFNDCISYFETKTKEKNHPNQIYNDSKGYLNSIHQAIICYRNLRNYNKSDSLINIGINYTTQSADFPAEKNYFIKCKGISDYYQKNYKSSLENLGKALPLFKKNSDVYWIAVSNFYIGKSFYEQNKQELAINQFEKVDTIFKRSQFIFPELQENYELLISYYQKHKDSRKELLYTKSLLKVDSILKKDFPKLSSQIHRRYDNEILSEAKNNLENRSRWGMGFISILVITVIILFLWGWKYYQNEKLIKQKYSELEERLQRNSMPPVSISYENTPPKSRLIVSEEVFSDLQNKLNKFEATKGFTKQGLTIEQLAETLNSNKSYLSQCINDVKGVNFSKYISNLRISYITQLMYSDPKYLKLKIQTLAEECGMSSRQSFSDLFQEINGIRPTDFIKQRKKELEEKGDISLSASSSEP